MKRFWKDGDPWIWLTGAALGLCLLMVAGLILLIVVSGLGFFWPHPVTRFVLSDGTAVVGALMKREVIPHPSGKPGEEGAHRIQVRQGNRDLYKSDFVWIDESKIARREEPAEILLVERAEYGDLFGTIKELRDGDKVIAKGPEESYRSLLERLPAARKLAEQITTLQEDRIGDVNDRQVRVQRKLKKLALNGVTSGPKVEELHREDEQLKKEYEGLASELATLRQSRHDAAVFGVEGGKEKELALDQIVRIVRPNQMGFFSKLGFYLAKIWEFVADKPRESNTEGGVFPAIFGTVMLVILMSLFVTPLGILAALYMREYAKQGTFVSIVRIAVNNLAGVPSIVFGVFGVGFFIYRIGGTIDRLFFPEVLPAPTFGTGGILWASLTLALLTVPVVIVATEEGLASIPKGLREASLALGATKFETTWRVVLPALMPSILTGLILAMARAAGEVAPLMITGVVKLAPSLPLDGSFPFLHTDRKFMHLGFHIYDVGFQSPNVDAARPMVFTTTLLLLLIVVFLNLTAIVLRKRLRRKFQMSAL